MVTRDGMTYEEAFEFFDFNIMGAWVGKKTPMFLESFEINPHVRTLPKCLPYGIKKEMRLQALKGKKNNE